MHEWCLLVTNPLPLLWGGGGIQTDAKIDNTPPPYIIDATSAGGLTVIQSAFLYSKCNQSFNDLYSIFIMIYLIKVSNVRIRN